MLSVDVSVDPLSYGVQLEHSDSARWDQQQQSELLQGCCCCSHLLSICLQGVLHGVQNWCWRAHQDFAS